MTVLLILVSLLLASAGAWLLTAKRRSIWAWLLVVVSLFPLLAGQSAVKAVFTWLALLGIAGFLVTASKGLASGADDAAA